MAAMKLRQRGKGTGQMAGKIDPGRGKGSGSWTSGFPGGAGAGRSISIRLRFILIVIGVIALAVWDPPAETRAAGQLPWELREVSVSVRVGNQVRPSLAGSTVVFLDQAGSPAETMVQKEIEAGVETPLPFATGVHAGPEADAASVSWQSPDQQACMAPLAGGASKCLALPAAWSALLELRYQLPSGLKRFRTGLYVSARDDAGREVWFPGLPPAS